MFENLNFLFKGFVKMNGKTPVDKIKNVKKYSTFEDVKDLDGFGGILKSGWIMIDVDSKKESKILKDLLDDEKIKYNTTKTTKGRHFYFRNNNEFSNKTSIPLALGIVADVKLGEKPTVTPLKIDGDERETDIKYTLDEVDQLPSFLKPLGKKVKNEYDFFNLEYGDGRNQTLFNYILVLQKASLCKEEIKACIGYINKYILKDKLDDSELNIILRDESFSKPNFYNEKGQLAHNLLGDYLINEYKIIKIDNVIHIYDEGIYKNDTDLIENKMIKVISAINKTKRNEILAYIQVQVKNTQLSPPTKIVCNNGLYDLKKKTLEPFTSDYISLNKLPINFNDGAYSKVVDDTLLKLACNNKSLMNLMLEMIAYCLYRRNERGKAFILVGDGANGKSTLLDMINGLLGEENVANIGLDELGKRFVNSEIYGKLANIGDDISNNYICDNSLFKKFVTGNRVTVEEKGMKPRIIKPYAKLIFSANEIPRINDTSTGLKRRLILIPFNARFKKSDADYNPYIIDELLTNESLEYLLFKAINLIDKVILDGFTKVDVVDVAIDEYEKENNPILSFLEEIKIDNEPIIESYLKYSTWCITSNLKPLSKIGFGKEIKRLGFNSKQIKVNNKNVRIYIKEGEIDEL